MNPKPLVFVDLDDTLFQTHRKQKPTALYNVATTDISGQPLSYTNPKQQVFVNWLMQTTEMVAVTARSVDGFKRVQLPFQHGAICSHGGTILGKDLEVDREWLDLKIQANQELKLVLHEVESIFHDYAKATDLGTLRTWTLSENGLEIYAVAKQNDPTTLVLDQLVQQIPQHLLAHCYIHINGNNLAIIPNHISKQKAVEFFIEKYDPHHERVILGWGDSLSDAGFLSCCDWFGMPKNSQLDKFLNQNLSQDQDTKGYLGHV